MSSALARLRGLDPLRLDLIVGAAFLVEGLIELEVLVPAGTPDRPIAAAALVVIAAALAFRRRWPLTATLASWAVFTTMNGLPRPYGDQMVSPLFAVIFLIYSAGRHLDDRRAAFVFVAGSGLIVVSNSIDHFQDSVANTLTSILFGIVAPMLIGRFMRHRSSLHGTLREKTARLAHEREQRAAAAAADERTRIAGELHDVVAHALSAMVVQGGAARRLAVKDPERASAAFAAVEGTGREALAEIRSLLGVLRREDEELALAPHPSLRHVSSLVARVRAAGLPVDLVVEGESRPLPAGVDLTAYRVVQEALRSALEQGHAGHADVLLRYGADDVVVRVDDDGPAETRALPGVRERVTLYGGHLRAGARRDGGHGVRARLPVGGPA
jgi:signal transduction histidine kinase